MSKEQEKDAVSRPTDAEMMEQCDLLEAESEALKLQEKLQRLKLEVAERKAQVNQLMQTTPVEISKPTSTQNLMQH